MKTRIILVSICLVCALVSFAGAFGYFTETPPASFKIADVVGDAGQEIRFDGVLSGGQDRVATLSMDLLYDPANLEVDARPRCNLASGQPPDIILGASDVAVGDGRRLKVSILSSGGVLRDGIAFQCHVRIPASRGPGVYHLEPSVDAYDTARQHVPLGVQSSTVQVAARSAMWGTSNQDGRAALPQAPDVKVVKVMLEWGSDTSIEDDSPPPRRHCYLVGKMLVC